MEISNLSISFDQLVSECSKVLVVQADNPDADSLGSAIALEQLLTHLKKDVYLYSAVPVPEYLRYVEGWDRVSNEFIADFDLTIFVDVSTKTLLKKIIELNYYERIKKNDIIVIDHHKTVSNNIESTKLSIILDEESSTGQIVYQLGKNNGYNLNDLFLKSVYISIMGDTQGLSNQLATPKTFKIIAEIIEQGIDRFQIEEKRKSFSNYSTEIYKYKANLINRTELYADNRVAIIRLNQDDINNYSQSYNQAPLMHPEILQIKGIALSIVLKFYNDGHVTGSIRSNISFPIAADLASLFDGGGHEYASGFNIRRDDSNEFIEELISKSTKLLDNL